MHELSIATALVSGVCDALDDAREDRAVEAVTARIGDLAGVVTAALEFAWPVAAEGTRCEGAELRIERVAGRVRCAACELESDVGVPPRFRCGRCGRPSADVTRGRELELVSVELEEAAEIAETDESSIHSGEVPHEAAHP